MTGATSGIGKQLALDYADSGWRVIACGRNESVLEELSKHSSLIETLRFDVTSYEETMQALSSLSFVPVRVTSSNVIIELAPFGRVGGRWHIA